MAAAERLSVIEYAPTASAASAPEGGAESARHRMYQAPERRGRGGGGEGISTAASV